METESARKGKSNPSTEQVKLGYYWTYLVKPHSQWMTVKCIINAAEKMVPALIDSVFSAQIKEEFSQPTLLKPMLNTCNFKDQIQK